MPMSVRSRYGTSLAETGEGDIRHRPDGRGRQAPDPEDNEGCLSFALLGPAPKPEPSGRSRTISGKIESRPRRASLHQHDLAVGRHLDVADLPLAGLAPELE